ncbi:uncharacterized protein LOC123541861 [Mercenaria mercenaria]|uniref:uncharacterized protein LOC123541861 n=1 Tax=Mercenaria mercenaria TaxID=6596 RepID=UPI00234F8CF0|nr:uncharacterized protein LOC123541861 [Mercenaria mercenaria]
MDFRSKNMILSGFILFLSALGWSAAIQCYECDSDRFDACVDPFVKRTSSIAAYFESGSTDCKACIKKIRQRPEDTDGDLYFERYCSDTYHSGCEKDNDGDVTCSCVSDLCNGGSSSRLKITTVAFISSLPLIIYKFGL